jgi:hypothetical protein
MDTYNWFFTTATVRHARLEYLVALLALVALAVAHAAQINWWLFAALFFYIDLVGTVPGTLAHMASSDKHISRVYYLLYNIMHSALTQGAVVGVLCATIGWRWIYLAIPIHLCLDRGAFNNYLKPFGFQFVAARTPEFVTLQHTFAEAAGPATDIQVLSGRS